MSWGRLVPAAFALLALALPGFIYVTHIRWLGFPDGYLTDLDRAERALFWIAIWPGFALGLYLLHLVRPNSSSTTLRKKVITIMVLVSDISAVALIQHDLGTQLDAGQGG